MRPEAWLTRKFSTALQVWFLKNAVTFIIQPSRYSRVGSGTHIAINDFHECILPVAILLLHTARPKQRKVIWYRRQNGC